MFDAGRHVYEEVTGKPSAATEPPELERELDLPADQQAAWAACMETEIARYKAETARLEIEQGGVSAEIFAAIDPKAAAEIARLRMAARPLIVRRMAHVLLIPAYVIALDDVTIFVDNVFAGGSIYKELLTWALPTAASIVLAYMGPRSGEKLKGAAGVGRGAPAGA